MPGIIHRQLSLFAGRVKTEQAELAGVVPRVGGNQIELCVLASGSSGNATLVRVGGTRGDVMLIDAGIGPRTMGKRLDGTGVDISDIRAICLTHLDQDHFRPSWVATLLKFRITIYLNRRHLNSLKRADPDGLLESSGLVGFVERDGVEPMAGVQVEPILLPHDWKGSTGYLVRSMGEGCQTLGYATDLGSVPDQMIEQFIGVDLLAIEANYDRQMQIDSPRPASLKTRIMGGQGHLSNNQAFDAVRRIVGASPAGKPSRVVLLHRSRQCNSPDCIRRVFAADPGLHARVTLTDQYEPTGWLTHKREPKAIDCCGKASQVAV